MAATKQEFLDILNTIGVRASNGCFWSIGMAGLISRMADEVKRNSQVTVCRAEGEWTLEGDDSELVLKVVPASEMIRY